MRLAFATDEENEATSSLISHLRHNGHEVEVLVPGAEWPEVGRAVGEAVAGGRTEAGIVCCHTGTGVSIAANKVPGVRAALCGDPEIAEGARRWNDANVLALALSRVDSGSAAAIADAFLAGRVDAGDQAAVARVERSGDRD